MTLSTGRPKEIASYAREHGISATADAFDVKASSVERYLREFDMPVVEGLGPKKDVDNESTKAEAQRLYLRVSDRERKKLHQKITFQSSPIGLVFLGDQHIGNAGCDIDRVFDEAKLINETPRMYAWCLGDVVDNYVIGKLNALNAKPSLAIIEQWELAKEYLECFGSSLIAVQGGGYAHDMWTHRLTQIDYNRDIAPRGPLYDKDEIRASVYVENHEYRIRARHKWRGGSIYNQTHGQERAARFDTPDFDIYAGAHNHTGGVCREFIHDNKRKIAVQTGTYKKYDEYHREGGWPGHDASTGVTVILHDDGSIMGCADLPAAAHYLSQI